MALFSGKVSFRNWIKPYLGVIKTDIADEVSHLQGQIDALQTSSVALEHYELLEHHQPSTGGMFIEVKDPKKAHIQYMHLFMPMVISNKQFSLCVATIDGVRKINLK